MDTVETEAWSSGEDVRIQQKGRYFPRANLADAGPQWVSIRRAMEPDLMDIISWIEVLQVIPRLCM